MTNTESYVLDGIPTAMEERDRVNLRATVHCPCGYNVDTQPLDTGSEAHHRALLALRFHYSFCRQARGFGPLDPPRG